MASSSPQSIVGYGGPNEVKRWLEGDVTGWLGTDETIACSSPKRNIKSRTRVHEIEWARYWGLTMMIISSGEVKKKNCTYVAR